MIQKEKEEVSPEKVISVYEKFINTTNFVTFTIEALMSLSDQHNLNKDWLNALKEKQDHFSNQLLNNKEISLFDDLGQPSFTLEKLNKIEDQLAIDELLLKSLIVMNEIENPTERILEFCCKSIKERIDSLHETYSLFVGGLNESR